MKLHQVDPTHYVIRRQDNPRMNVDAHIYADGVLIRQMQGDKTLDQLIHTASLPGVFSHVVLMPDGHQGYGFPIGGVAAFDIDHGVVSAGGVGFDINCGVRVLRLDKKLQEVLPRIQEFVLALFQAIPCGAGRSGKSKLTKSDLRSLLSNGAKWCLEKGYALEEDLDSTEESGSLKGADPDAVSDRAMERGRDQLGTLGSGNHFVEIQYIEKIYDESLAQTNGLTVNDVIVMIHSGSRGLGHQVCSDHLDSMQSVVRRLGLDIPDRQLACAPIRSPEGQSYLAAMRAAANFAFANRQMITETIRSSLRSLFGEGKCTVVYDVAHNIAKEETYTFGRGTVKLLVHRKGATRAFPAKHPDLKDKFHAYGQPVLIPGSMGTSSYILVGSDISGMRTFFSACHGAGRAKSRTAAGKDMNAFDLIESLRSRGIYVQGASKSGLVEEHPLAYKDVDAVVDVIEVAGIARKVARLKPIGVIKG